jgi:hypothetical protein
MQYPAIQRSSPLPVSLSSQDAAARSKASPFWEPEISEIETGMTAYDGCDLGTIHDSNKKLKAVLHSYKHWDVFPTNVTNSSSVSRTCVIFLIGN